MQCLIQMFSYWRTRVRWKVMVSMLCGELLIYNNTLSLERSLLNETICIVLVNVSVQNVLRNGNFLA